MTDTPISTERIREMREQVESADGFAALGARILWGEMKAILDLASRALSPPGLALEEIERIENEIIEAIEPFVRPYMEQDPLDGRAPFVLLHLSPHDIDRLRLALGYDATSEEVPFRLLAFKRIENAIRSRLSALPESGGAAIDPGIAALAKAGEALREHWVESGGSDLESSEMLDVLEDAGVIKEVAGGYKRAVHGESEFSCEDGDPWYTETREVYRARLAMERGEFVSAPSPDALAQERAGETAASKVAEAVRELAATKSGHELHRAVDALFCDTMRALGYNEAADVFLEAIGEAHRT